MIPHADPLVIHLESELGQLLLELLLPLVGGLQLASQPLVLLGELGDQALPLPLVGAVMGLDLGQGLAEGGQVGLEVAHPLLVLLLHDLDLEPEAVLFLLQLLKIKERKYYN